MKLLNFDEPQELLAPEIAEIIGGDDGPGYDENGMPGYYVDIRTTGFGGRSYFTLTLQQSQAGQNLANSVPSIDTYRNEIAAGGDGSASYNLLWGSMYMGLANALGSSPPATIQIPVDTPSTPTTTTVFIPASYCQDNGDGTFTYYTQYGHEGPTVGGSTASYGCD